ncbi:small acid-soluble spore protein P [Salipaludibacillus keqinensis]|nr:small acid-soluble spore protein P [Salipaludibacillus keqinensis]
MEKNTFKSQRRSNPKSEGEQPGQPAPMKGSHKTKKKNHVSQTNGEG